MARAPLRRGQLGRTDGCVLRPSRRRDVAQVSDCRPVNSADLRRPLRRELAALQEKLQQAKPQNAKQATFHQIVSSHLDGQLAGMAAQDPSVSLFQYKDERKRMRLIWCWGYQRTSSEPARATLCPAEDCRQLALVSELATHHCLRCNQDLLPRRRLRKSAGAFLLLLAVAATAALGAWWHFANSGAHGRAEPVARSVISGGKETPPTGVEATKQSSPPDVEATEAGAKPPAASLDDVADIAMDANVEASRKLVLSGQVVDSLTDEPITAATVSLVGATDATRTDAAGRFRIEAPFSNSAQVEVSALGYATQRLAPELKAGEETSLRVQLTGVAVLVGQVIEADSQRAVSGARVAVAGTSGSAETDADGRFRIEGLRPGIAKLDASAAGYATAQSEADLKATEETSVCLRLPGTAVLAGQVVDASSQSPLANAKVAVAGTPHTAATDSEGRFRIERLCGGAAQIDVTASGYLPVQIDKELKPAEETTLCVPLDGVAILTGRVIDAATKSAVAKATVLAPGASRTAETDAEGRFRLSDLPCGSLEVQVAAAGYASQRRTEQLTVNENSILVELGPERTKAELKPAPPASAAAPVPEPLVNFFGIQAKASSVSFVVDCSGSMEGQRLERTKAELVASIVNLSPQQKFYVSFFHDQAIPMSAAQTPMPASPVEKVRCYTWIKTIGSTGGTQPESSLQLVARMNPDAIFLLSDGEFSPLNPETFETFSNNEIVVNTVAFADESAATRLREIADRTGGTYRFVPAGDPPGNPELTIATWLLRGVSTPPPHDAQPFREGLRELCDGQDCGPPPDASAAEQKQAAKAWAEWWTTNRLVPIYEGLDQNALLAEFRSSLSLCRWGALVAARRRRLDLPNEYVAALRDPSSMVCQAARANLVELSGGEDYGPAENASDVERAKSLTNWSPGASGKN